jgi:two-component system response regulator FixJ
MSEGTIFVIDDDEAVRDSLGSLLIAADLNVMPFASAEAFLLGYTPVPVSCAIVDLRMPGMDGVSLLEHLRSKGLNLPVIVVTGHADVPMAVRAMKAGALDFIEKPYTNAAMQEAVRRALDSARAGALGQIDQFDARSRIASLTARERDILRLLVIGHPNKIIAFQLNISPRTVEIHRANVMKKMNADSLSHLVRMALAVGFSGDDSGAAAVSETP